MLDLETIARDRAERCAYWRAQGVYADFTYADAIREAVAKGGAQRLVFHSKLQPADATVAEMDAVAERVAGAFHALGLRAGDSIAVMLPTWREATLAYLAAFKLGLVVVPIVAIYGAREAGFILRQTETSAIIIPSLWRGREFPALIAGAGPFPALRHVIVVGDSDGGVRWDELERGEAGGYPAPDVNADETCLIIYTSGTTADPKGVKHTHNTMLCDLNAMRASGAPPMMPPEPEGPALVVFPAGHIAGFLAMMRPFTAPGGHMIYVDHWDPEEGARLIERHKIASTMGTPIFLTTLMAAAARLGADISSLKRFTLGASSVTPDNVRATDRLGFPGGRTYGMSEHTVVSTSIGETFEKRAHTDGKVTLRNEVRIVDDAGRDVPTGQAGEVVTRGPRLFMGYVDKELDRAAFLPGGWYKSGDIGVLDADGYLTITDRKKDIIIRGGENISAKEVEDALGSMPGVIESAVTAMPDPMLGERVCAFIVAESGTQITAADVDAHFRAIGMTRQKTPERVVLVDDLPRTASGKVKKAELRDQLRET
jgi:acyl-CoA synthetase (AMP-forming)/AMP-acid ligase II